MVRPDREVVQHSPEEATAAFFSQDYRVVGQDLAPKVDEPTHPGMLVVSDSGIIRIDEVRMYSRAENDQNKNYRQMLAMEPGTFFAMDYTFRSSVLPLIVLNDGGEAGACAEIHKASRYNPEKNEFVPLKKKREITEALGLTPNEQASLQFGKHPDALLLTRQSDGLDQGAELTPSTPMNPDTAAKIVENLLRVN